jgi:hypothetical protein
MSALHWQSHAAFNSAVRLPGYILDLKMGAFPSQKSRQFEGEKYGEIHP